MLGCDTRLLQPFRSSNLSKFGSMKMGLLLLDPEIVAQGQKEASGGNDCGRTEGTTPQACWGQRYQRQSEGAGVGEKCLLEGFQYEDWPLSSVGSLALAFTALNVASTRDQGCCGRPSKTSRSKAGAMKGCSTGCRQAPVGKALCSSYCRLNLEHGGTRATGVIFVLPSQDGMGKRVPLTLSPKSPPAEHRLSASSALGLQEV